VKKFFNALDLMIRSDYSIAEILTDKINNYFYSNTLSETGVVLSGKFGYTFYNNFSNFLNNHFEEVVITNGGIREGENNIQVILLHDKKSKQLNNFTPSNFEEELNQKAFKDHLGEFVISSFPYEEIVEKDALFTDITSTICNHANVKRVMIIPNHEKEELWNDLRMALNRVDDENKKITLFAMQPMPGGNFKQEILGYSLMSALGIKGSELKD